MAFQKKAGKYAKKQGARAVKYVRKRYAPKGNLNWKNIQKDVTMLKSLVNAEKKRSDVTTGGAVSFGATSGAGVSGNYCVQLSPTIAQGTSGATRNGNSLKLVSGCLDLYFNQSVNTVNQVKIRYQIFCRADNTVDMNGATAAISLLEPNPFSAVIDYHSNRDPEYFSAFRVIKSGTVTLQQDAIAAGISYSQLKIPMKFNHHLKYNTDATTTTSKNKFFIIFTADTGDAVALTGAQVQFNMRWYYTDN